MMLVHCMYLVSMRSFCNLRLSVKAPAAGSTAVGSTAGGSAPAAGKALAAAREFYMYHLFGIVRHLGRVSKDKILVMDIFLRNQKQDSWFAM